MRVACSGTHRTQLQRLALDDPFGFEPTTLEVFGYVAARVHQVKRTMRISRA